MHVITQLSDVSSLNKQTTQTTLVLWCYIYLETKQHTLMSEEDGNDLSAIKMN